ncbi:MAG: alpha/beta hydrolase family protein, partial [Bacteroidales bacterium]
PTLSAYGPHDKIVPVALKFKLFEKLDKYGVPNEYIEFPHSGHAMAGDPDKHVVFLQKALEYCQKYLE